MNESPVTPPSKNSSIMGQRKRSNELKWLKGSVIPQGTICTDTEASIRSKIYLKKLFIIKFIIINYLFKNYLFIYSEAKFNYKKKRINTKISIGMSSEGTEYFSRIFMSWDEHQFRKVQKLINLR